MAPRRLSTRKFPCVVCTGDVGDNQQALLCTMCDTWCHAKCPSGSVNIKPATLTSHSDEPDLPWFCCECRKVLPTVLKAFREFECYKEDIEKYRQATDAALASLTTEITKLKDSVHHPSVPPVSSVNPAAGFDIEAEVREAIEKESKKRNLVIVGLAEADVDSVRSEGDTDLVNELCDATGTPRSDVIDVFRSGRMPEITTDSEGNERLPCRVTKVKFSCSSSRKRFLEKFIEKRPVSVGKAYVRPDMTFRERQADKSLRNELFARRRVDPSGDWVINRGNIVKRRVRREPPVEASD